MKSSAREREPRSPATLSATEALSRSKPLARLGALLRESEARLQAVLPVLPAALRAQVRAGPLDPEGWSLVAANPAVAAKLRQLEPRMVAALAGAGFATEVKLRLKVGSAG